MEAAAEVSQHDEPEASEPNEGPAEAPDAALSKPPVARPSTPQASNALVGGNAQGGGATGESIVAIGTMIRKWLIKSKIGGGAFGETFEAVDTSAESSASHRELCIK